MLLSELKTLLSIFSSPEKTYAYQGDTLSELQKLESYLTFFQLELLLSEYEALLVVDVQVLEQAIKGFLFYRWNRIQNTNSAYTQNTDNPANQLCFAIACELQSITGISLFYWLMPSVYSPEKHDQNDEIFTLNTRIIDFVLSDDNRTPINVIDTLLNYSKTGEFAYRSIQSGNNIALSDSEKSRVIHHSKISENLYHRIQPLVEKGKPLSPHLSKILKPYADHQTISSFQYPKDNESQFIHTLIALDVKPYHLFSFVNFFELIKELTPNSRSILLNHLLNDNPEGKACIINFIDSLKILKNICEILPSDACLALLKETNLLNIFLRDAKQSQRSIALRQLLAINKACNNPEEFKKLLDKDIINFYLEISKDLRASFNINEKEFYIKNDPLESSEPQELTQTVEEKKTIVIDLASSESENSNTASIDEAIEVDETFFYASRKNIFPSGVAPLSVAFDTAAIFNEAPSVDSALNISSLDTSVTDMSASVTLEPPTLTPTVATTEAPIIVNLMIETAANEKPEPISLKRKNDNESLNEASPAKSQRIDEKQTSPNMLNTSPNFFRAKPAAVIKSHLTDIETFYAKIEKSKKYQRPLEAFHYIRRALDFINLYDDKEEIKIQKIRLRQLAVMSLNILTGKMGNKTWAQCLTSYETYPNKEHLRDWVNCMKIVTEQLIPDKVGPIDEMIINKTYSAFTPASMGYDSPLKR